MPSLSSQLRQPAATPARCAKDKQFHRDQFFRFVKVFCRLRSSILQIGKEIFELIVMRPMTRVRNFDQRHWRHNRNGLYYQPFSAPAQPRVLSQSTRMTPVCNWSNRHAKTKQNPRRNLARPEFGYLALQIRGD
jgi:hypothetical protein